MGDNIGWRVIDEIVGLFWNDLVRDIWVDILINLEYRVKNFSFGIIMDENL